MPNTRAFAARPDRNVVIAAPLLVFVLAFFFSLGITLRWPHYAVLSLGYNLAMFGMAAALIMALRREPQLQVGPRYVALMTALNHVALIFGFVLIGGAPSLLWPADTLDHHLPNAMAFSRWLCGTGDFAFSGDDNPFKKLYFSNMWVGIFISIFGAHPVVSACAMLVIKLITIFLIYRAAHNIANSHWTATTATIIYGLMPTITFYTLQFYKEYFIHFLVALLLFLVSRAKDRRGLIVMMLLPLAVLFIERFYVMTALCVAFAVYFWTLTESAIKKIGILTLAGISVAFTLAYYFHGNGVIGLVEIMKSFRSVHNQAADATPTTNFALDLFRITFTPFFNLYKVKFFDGFDSILIFGGFIHGVVMLFYARGLWVERRNEIVILNIAFLMLLLLLAFVMPFDGRARDSLYPLISIFAAIGIASLFRATSERKLAHAET